MISDEERLWAGNFLLYTFILLYFILLYFILLRCDDFFQSMVDGFPIVIAFDELVAVFGNFLV